MLNLEAVAERKGVRLVILHERASFEKGAAAHVFVLAPIV